MVGRNGISRGGSGCSITKLGCASTIVAGATSRVAVGATDCCAAEAPTAKSATQPIMADNDKFLIRDLNCIDWFSFRIGCLCARIPVRSVYILRRFEKPREQFG